MSKFSDPEFLECVRFMRTPIKYETPKRDFCVLSYRLFGEAFFYHDGKEYRANKNNVLFLPANIEYTQKCGDEELICVHFKPGSDVFPDKICIYEPENILFVKEIFCDLHNSYSNHGVSNMMKTKSLFYELCYLLCKKEQDDFESVIEPSVKYINENYRNLDITVGKIAAASNISEVYFRKVFVLKYGQSPVKYINELRIKYACALLHGKYFTLDEVAAQSGFDNSKYFSRVFSDILGISPGKYAKRKLK